MLSLLYLGILYFSHAETTPCNIASTIDITNAEVLANNSIIHDEIEYSDKQWFEQLQDDNITISRRGCICLIKKCLWKCCPDGQAFFGRSCDVTSDPTVNPFSPVVHEGFTVLEDIVGKDHFTFFYGNPCPEERYILDPSVQDDKFYLQQDGILYQPGAVSAREQYHPAVSFCLDLFEQDPRSSNNTSWEPRLMAAACFGDESSEPVTQALYGVYAIGLLISVPFLAATLAVYGFLPELRNLHGMCLMAYVSGLIVAFSCLAFLQLSANDVVGSMTRCHLVAFLIYYFFMSSFFWLNVMCFDIWRTFSRYGGKSINPSRERRRFVWYGVYAWGMSLVLTGVTALMQFHQDIPDYHVKPNFGITKCWFADRAGELVYFYCPIFALVVVNSVLFGVTAHSILRIRRETAILKSSESARTDQYERDKQRYALYLKLFIVMGVNWTLEVLSFFVKGSDWMWIVADVTNCALGIIIFVLFVWKNKVRNLLIKRYRRLRYGTSRGGAQRSTTWTTRDSVTHTEDTRVHSDDCHQLATLKSN